MRFLESPLGERLVAKGFLFGILALYALTPPPSAAQGRILVSKSKLSCILENAESYLKSVSADMILIFANFCPDNRPDRAALSELSAAIGVDIVPGSDEETEQTVFSLSRSELRCLSESERVGPLVQSSEDLVDIVGIIEEICGSR